MRYELDDTTVQYIRDLCDLALRAGGMSNMSVVQHVLTAVASAEQREKDDATM